MAVKPFLVPAVGNQGCCAGGRCCTIRRRNAHNTDICGARRCFDGEDNEASVDGRVQTRGDNATEKQWSTGDYSGRLVLAVYHDRIARTDAGWRFAERVFRGSYIDTIAMPGRIDCA